MEYIVRNLGALCTGIQYLSKMTSNANQRLNKMRNQ